MENKFEQLKKYYAYSLIWLDRDSTYAYDYRQGDYRDIQMLFNGICEKHPQLKLEEIDKIVNNKKQFHKCIEILSSAELIDIPSIEDIIDFLKKYPLNNSDKKMCEEDIKMVTDCFDIEQGDWFGTDVTECDHPCVELVEKGIKEYFSYGYNCIDIDESLDEAKETLLHKIITETCIFEFLHKFLDMPFARVKKEEEKDAPVKDDANKYLCAFIDEQNIIWTREMVSEYFKNVDEKLIIEISVAKNCEQEAEIYKEIFLTDIVDIDDLVNVYFDKELEFLKSENGLTLCIKNDEAQKNNLFEENISAVFEQESYDEIG